MRIRCLTAAFTALLGCTSVVATQPAHAAGLLGGILENPVVKSLRAVLTRQQVESFVPNRGAFTFPAPYNTQGVRLTNADDCGGRDCIDYIGYSYWNNINNHRGQDTMLIFVGMDRNNGGKGPTLLQYNKVNNKLDNLGPLFDANTSMGWATGEGWYFSATMPTTLYVNSDSRLFRYDVLSKKLTTVFDAASHLGAGHTIWQIHSSATDRVHSATVVRNGSFQGCMVYQEDSRKYSYFPRKGAYDECQIDKSGRWLVIKENVDGRDGEDNRIIDVTTGQERVLNDRDGAGGHSDLGWGYMLAIDNWARNANTYRVWRFDQPTLTGNPVYYNSDWNISAPDHVSLGNSSSSSGAIEKQYSCGSSLNRSNAAEANEIVCFNLDSTNRSVAVAPVMTNLNAAGGGNDYAKLPKGNLDPTGEYFIWTSNLGGNRLDAFLVKIPKDLLGGTSTATPTTPTPTPTPPVVTPSKPAVPPANEGSSSSPQQSAIAVDSITRNGARITWRTSKAAQSMVRYGTTTDYGSSSTLNERYLTTHTVSLSGLQAGTRYNYRIYSRDAQGNTTTSSNLTFTTAAAASNSGSGSGASSPQVADVIWSNMQNATVSSGTLVKTNSCDGCSNSTASSQQVLSEGNGALEFTANNVSGLSFIGISKSSNINALDFAFRIQAGSVEVRERGAWRADAQLPRGAKLKIAVNNGKVSYQVNGKTIYTSQQAPSYPLKVYTQLYNTSSAITDAKVLKL